MIDAARWFGAVLLVGLAVTVPAYVALVGAIRRDDPEAFEALGRPHILMGSPSRSVALQRYIYAQSLRPTATPRIVAWCRLLAVVTPVFVVLVFWTIAQIVLAATAARSH